jgi:hypothetical protein
MNSSQFIYINILVFYFFHFGNRIVYMDIPMGFLTIKAILTMHTQGGKN